MLEYSYPLFRPPAEANNLILQVTHGCSYNKCSFCSMYKTKKFKIKPLKDIYKQIDALADYYPDIIKIFLADGDALTLDTKYLLQILQYLQKNFPKLRRVSTYASTQNILSKSVSELKKLEENRLNLFYYGIESGNDTLLKNINKGVTSKEIIKSLQMVNETKIKISATIILGLGGKELSQEHIKNTAQLVSQVKINYLSTLQLGLEENESENFYKNFPYFTHLNDTEILKEQKELLAQINPKSKIIFRSNHASNALHLAGTLPKDKESLLSQINQALLVGEEAFIPQILRGF